MVDGMKCPRCGATSNDKSIYCNNCYNDGVNTWSKGRRKK